MPLLIGPVTRMTGNEQGPLFGFKPCATAVRRQPLYMRHTLYPLSYPGTHIMPL